MLFNENGFVLFVGVCFVVLRLTPVRRRWIALLLLSLVFYATFHAGGLLLILGAVSGIAWLAGLLVDGTEDDGARRRWAFVGVGAILALLVLVRVVAHPASAAEWAPASLRLGTTIGVSYFTIQAISYVVDVYMGRTRVERNVARVTAYLAFFPKLVQGPIERASALMPQLAAPATASYEGLRSAIILFGWGLLKKVVLADRLAQLVDPVYAAPQQFAGLVPALTMYAYAFQLYFDFSGYTDMARGTARILGIELSKNFNAPYLATTISEFWRRWHMSFSGWLLDYVFKPLQLMLRRYRVTGTAVALFATFGLCGLWHGASLTFVIWGVLHGSYLAVETLWKGRKRRRVADRGWSQVARVVLTFHLVAIAWVFFRAPTVRTACLMLTGVFQSTKGLDILLARVGSRWVAITAATCLIYGSALMLRDRPVLRKLSSVAVLRWAAYLTLFVAVLLLREDSSRYIYSQF
jgi:alginate O-acetyltransferase complex protein AlgI